MGEMIKVGEGSFFLSLMAFSFSANDVINKQPSWRHVLYSQPYNASLSKPAIIQWKDWKSVLLPLLPSVALPATASLAPLSVPFVRHGSEDSRDEDRLYVFQQIPTAQEALQFVSGTAEDRNIITVTGGFVRYCYKGEMRFVVEF
jgi:hypothetical protein